MPGVFVTQQTIIAHKRLVDNLLKSCKINSMKKKILLVSVNDRSYSSYRYFAERLAEAFEQKGCQIGWCHVAPGDGEDVHAWQVTLAEAINFQPDAVVDFNSILPKMVVGGKSLPELFGVPFYHYVLDHPLYHKKALEAALPDYRCICVDMIHEVYIKLHYPQMISVFTHPLPGSAGANARKPFSERRNRILFTGTYENPGRYWELMKSLPQRQKKECMELADRMLHGMACSMEGAITPENAGYLFLADAYVRHSRREKCIRALIEAGVPMDIYGNGWGELDISESHIADLRIFPSVMYSDYVNKTGNYRIALNIMPGFVQGSHDRITCAMRNGTAVLTDENPYVRERYLHGGKAVCIAGEVSGAYAGSVADETVVAAFSWEHPEQIGELAEQMLTDCRETEELAYKGMCYGELHYRWEALAERILEDLAR